MSRITPTLAICTLAASITVAGFALPNKEDDQPTPVDGSATMQILNFAFADLPPLAPANTLTVANDDPVEHTLTAIDGAFDTGVLAPGEHTELIVPAEPGTYAFFCEIHPSMTGTLTVSS